MDIQTFEAEVLKIERLLYRVSWSMLSNQEDCADAVQEALTKAWQKRDTLRSRKAFRSWMVQILSNVCRDMLRKRQHRQTVPLEDNAVADTADEANPFLVTDFLLSLSPEHRTAVVLHYLEGYRVRDISQMLSIPEGTIKSRLMYARESLRRTANLNTNREGELTHEKA